MSGSVFRVPPLSRSKIRYVAQQLHETVRLTEPPFPIVEFVEYVLPVAIEDFYFGVLPLAEMGGDEHGRTYPSNSAIYLREDVYDRAVQGHGRDRLTLAHEVGHLLLHNTGMRREMPSGSIKRYEDSEWQADCFGGELLIPDWYVKQAKCPAQVAEVCQVSLDAANFAWRVVRK